LKSQDLISRTTTETTFVESLASDVTTRDILIIFNKVDRLHSFIDTPDHIKPIIEEIIADTDYTLADLSSNSLKGQLDTGSGGCAWSGTNVCIELVENIGRTFGTSVHGRLTNNIESRRRTVQEIFWIKMDVPNTYIVADTIAETSNLEFMIMDLISLSFGVMPWTSEITGYSVDKSMVYKFDNDGVIARHSEVEVSNVSRLIGVPIGTLRGISATLGTSPRAKSLHQFYEVDDVPVLLSVTIDISSGTKIGNI